MDINCPYCESGLDICHDGGFGYEEDVYHEMECSDCGKSFVFTTSIIFCYEAKKADCLNGSEHDYQLTHTIPRPWSKMECTMCGVRRELTDNEKNEYKIGTIEDYVDKLKTKKIKDEN